MARISISGMRFYAHHGCFEQEQTIGTHFRVDLLFDTDSSLAEQSDNINDTVSYLDVYQVVKEEMEQPSHLLEHVVHRIGSRVLSSFLGVQKVTVRVYKINPPLGGQMDSVFVEQEYIR